MQLIHINVSALLFLSGGHVVELDSRTSVIQAVTLIVEAIFSLLLRFRLFAITHNFKLHLGHGCHGDGC